MIYSLDLRSQHWLDWQENKLKFEEAHLDGILEGVSDEVVKLEQSLEGAFPFRLACVRF
jgi:hypothetical protein